MADGATLIDAVYDPVGVVLHSSRKNDNLKELAQFGQELIAVWPDHIKEIVFSILKLPQVILVVLQIVLRADKMNKCFVQVKHKGIGLVQNTLGW